MQLFRSCGPRRTIVPCSSPRFWASIVFSKSLNLGPRAYTLQSTRACYRLVAAKLASHVAGLQWSHVESQWKPLAAIFNDSTYISSDQIWSGISHPKSMVSILLPISYRYNPIGQSG